ncbi:peptidyl-tRNA hydrolase [Marinitoga sp. 1135]|uniref:Peptidyl-tRNA hydrolase n=1 Tax=Marinitoga piezophila (strain DSM 14283 / JCM 11233 / KA3) TaxID=443254 RepID=H2J5T9_MARPK|nr:MULTISPECIES: aminoacyl-tRNA hydrolase [Marinitoga]AEX86158.1 peptidyl-tRNA hydrolase [Marinitoga piezophila KA3]APT76573.1 peptidyl-tRNA hydrolase [Marinitoga sp. 1137]NUU96340.1 peptidyl-tRNA hydrolase [Marinitoga sp. 1135]NUU98258.1 peptidyl-tRNA hydrolase [Marinitoga sp. 1138]
MKIIIGLGNPGPRYVFTKHNVGFLVIDRYYELNKQIFKKIEKNTFEGYINDDIILIKPLTYMNLSGKVFFELKNYIEEISPENILVIYDDISIDLGKIRIRPNGSAGGHNGLKSIISVLGTKDFPRIRVGIGPKPEGIDLADYVLSEFTNEEMYKLYKVIDKTVDAINIILGGKITDAMNKYNNRDLTGDD